MPVNSYHVWARNAALPLARGEWIMLIDDDDLIVPNHMEVMLRESQDADLVYVVAEIFDYVLKNGLRHAISRFLLYSGNEQLHRFT